MLGLPSCREVCEESSERLDNNKKPALKRIGFIIHLMICRRCRIYKKQLELTQATIKYWINGRSMPEEIRQNILQAYKDINPKASDGKHP